VGHKILCRLVQAILDYVPLDWNKSEILKSSSIVAEPLPETRPLDMETSRADKLNLDVSDKAQDSKPVNPSGSLLIL
jgi:hypothetical protein